MTTRQRIREQARKNYPSSKTHPKEGANFCGFTAGGAYGYNLAIDDICEWLCANLTDNAYLGANTQSVLRKHELIDKLEQIFKI